MDTLYIGIGVTIAIVIIYLIIKIKQENIIKDANNTKLNAEIAQYKKDIIELSNATTTLNKAIEQYKEKDLTDQKTIDNLNESIKQYKTGIQELQVKLDKVTVSLTAQIQMRDENTAELERVNKMNMDWIDEAIAHTGTLERYKIGYESLLPEMEALRTTIRNMLNYEGGLLAQIESHKQELMEAEKTRTELGQCQYDLSQARRAPIHLQNTINANEIQLADLQAQIVQQNDTLAALRGVLNETTTKKDNYVKMYNDLYIKYNNDISDLSNASASRDYYMAEYEKANAKMYEIQNLYNSRINELNKLQTDLADSVQQLESVKASLSAGQDEITALKNKLWYSDWYLSLEKKTTTDLTQQLTDVQAELQTVKNAINDINNFISVRHKYDPMLNKLQSIQKAMIQYAEQGQIGTCDFIKQKITNMINVIESIADDNNKCQKIDDIQAQLTAYADDPYNINAELLYNMINNACNSSSKPNLFNRAVFNAQISSLYLTVCQPNPHIQGFEAYVGTLRYQIGYLSISDNQSYFRSM